MLNWGAVSKSTNLSTCVFDDWGATVLLVLYSGSKYKTNKRYYQTAMWMFLSVFYAEKKKESTLSTTGDIIT